MAYIKEFPIGVVEQLDYYVYLLIDPENDQVFYIGKGTGNRIFAHINAAITDETPNDRLDKIRAIHAKGLKVKHIVHRHGLTEKEAFEVEAALIDFIGLSGITNQVQGYSSDDRGVMNVNEVIAKYQAPPAVIIEPVVLITVNRLYRRGMPADMLYEITRGRWKMHKRRRQHVQYAFAVYRGIVREVYEIHNWARSTRDTAKLRAWITKIGAKQDEKQNLRWIFDGAVSESLQSYVGKSTKDYQVIGAQNPIRYVNCGT